MKYNKFNRRMFLQGSGGVMLPIPFLLSLIPKNAQAQVATSVKRYLYFSGYYDYGHHKHWFPTLNQSDLKQKININGDNNVYYESLKNLVGNGPLSNAAGTSLNDYLDYINIYRGLDTPMYVGHSNSANLGYFTKDNYEKAWPTHKPIKTIDQVLQDKSSFNSNRKDVVITGISNRGLTARNGTRVPSLANDPQSLYNKLFLNGSLPESGNDSNIIIGDKRRNVLDNVLVDYKRVRASRKISSNDKKTLDEFMDRLSSIKNSLEKGGSNSGGQCKHKGISKNNDGKYFYSKVTGQSYADIMTAALLCDVTRVMVFEYGVNEYGGADVPASSDFHHTVSHEPWNTIKHNGQNMPCHEFLGKVYIGGVIKNTLAPLIKNMASAIEPGNNKSLLYNSLVHFSVQSAQLHSGNSVPAMTIGNAGGEINSGYMLDYQDRSKGPQNSNNQRFDNNPNHEKFHNNYPGVLYNRLLVTILQSMGLKPSDYEDNSLNKILLNRSDSRYGSQNNGLTKIGGYGYVAGEFQGTESGDWHENVQTEHLKHLYLNKSGEKLALPPVSQKNS